MVALDSNLDKKVAEMVSKETDALQSVAERVANETRARAARHNRTGAYIASVHVERLNHIDFAVVVDAPWVAAIEFGHTASGWYEDVAPGTWVPGIHALRDSAIEVQRQVRS